MKFWDGSSEFWFVILFTQIQFSFDLKMIFYYLSFPLFNEAITIQIQSGKVLNINKQLLIDHNLI